MRWLRFLKLFYAGRHLSAAANDAGIITLPDGEHLLLVVFVSDAKADDSTREGVIARIAKAAYDHYVHAAS